MIYSIKCFVRIQEGHKNRTATTSLIINNWIQRKQRLIIVWSTIKNEDVRKTTTYMTTTYGHHLWPPLLTTT